MAKFRGVTVLSLLLTVPVCERAVDGRGEPSDATKALAALQDLAEPRTVHRSSERSSREAG